MTFFLLDQADIWVSFKVGLALNEQMLPTEERVPMEKTDQRLDALILGDGSVLRRSE
jgi:5-formyltetrahydrofolate cyclo-ligase